MNDTPPEQPPVITQEDVQKVDPVLAMGPDRKNLYKVNDHEKSPLSAELLEHIRTIERAIRHSVFERMQVHPSSIVVLSSKKTTMSKGYRIDDTETWENRRYFMERHGAYYRINFDYDDSGVSCYAVLAEFPGEELLIKFAAIAARRVLAGGIKKLLPIDHPDYNSDQLLPPKDGATIERVDISYTHVDGEYDGPAPGQGTLSGSPFGEA